MQSETANNQNASRLQRSLNRQHNSYASLNSTEMKRASFGNSKDSSFVPASKIRNSENQNPVLITMTDQQLQNLIQSLSSNNAN